MAPSTRRSRRLRDVLGKAARLCVVVLAIGATRASLADQYHVPTGSMWPTIEPGDRIFVVKTAYGLRFPFTSAWLFDRGGPGRGDVVLFEDPRGGPIPLVKRVVALSGQTVRVRRGVLYIDDEPQRMEKLEDGRLIEHLGSLVHEAGGRDFEDYGPVTVPQGHLFVMGDNRPASLDSRFMGTVPRALVVGQVLGVFFRGEGLDLERLYRSIQ
jgi:signal peptidase I